MRPIRDEHLNRVLERHFNSRGGTPYWMDKARELGLQPLRDIRCREDLLLFGPMDGAALAQRPIEDFVPRSLWLRSSEERWVFGETGGTLGSPKTTIYRINEFKEAFVEPFVRAARAKRFPRDILWLYIGPSGPHIIGKAARACAWALGSPDPLTVDFDPRWVKKFDPESMSYRRYSDHIVEHSLRILHQQNVGVLFSTPVVLLRLAEHMRPVARSAIRGIHLGGMSLSASAHRTLAHEFPNAVFLSGYGNTLCGMCPEIDADPGDPLSYYPWGERLSFRLIVQDPASTEEERLLTPAPKAEPGQVVFSRLDESFLILNMIERDEAVRAVPGRIQREHGFTKEGLTSPQPVEERREVSVGLY